MAFRNVVFPLRIAFGATGGPRRRTEIVALTSGYEARNSIWEASRREYDISSGIKSYDDLLEVVEFWEAMRGRLDYFLWQDRLDFRSNQRNRGKGQGTDEDGSSFNYDLKGFKPVEDDDQRIGRGDGIKTEFQVIKKYEAKNFDGNVVASYDRNITKIKPGTFECNCAGVSEGESVDLTPFVDNSRFISAAGIINSEGYRRSNIVEVTPGSILIIDSTSINPSDHFVYFYNTNTPSRFANFVGNFRESDWVSTNNMITVPAGATHMGITQFLTEGTISSVGVDWTPTIRVSNTGWVLDYNSGKLTFPSGSIPRGEITCGYEFYVPVRFDTDELDVALEEYERGIIPSIPLVEVRDC